MAHPFDLEIIQPVFNPRDNWVEKYIDHYRELQIQFQDISFQIIFVNDGSTKNFTTETIKYLEQNIHPIKIISYPNNKGKGFAVRAGIKESTAPFVLYTDYDFPYKMKYLKIIYDNLKANSDIVIGVRNSEYYKHLGLKRKIVSKACIILNKSFLRIPYTDTQSGLKGFSQKGKELLLKTTVNEFLFDTELICMAYKNKTIKISTIDVILNKDIKFTRIHLKTILQETKNFFSILIRSSTKKFNG